MDGAQTGLKAKEAIDAAFHHFWEFYPKQDIKNELLEGVEYIENEHHWLISIGFDLAMTSERFAEQNGTFDFVLDPAPRRTSRESREFTLRDSDGSLVKMKTP